MKKIATIALAVILIALIGVAVKQSNILHNKQAENNDRKIEVDFAGLQFNPPQEGEITVEQTGNLSLIKYDDVAISNSVRGPYRGPDRGGWWGDMAYQILSEDELLNVCNRSSMVRELEAYRIYDCEINFNENGVMYVKTVQQVGSEGFNPEPGYYYFIFNEEAEKPSTVFSTANLIFQTDAIDLNSAENLIDEIINSIKFIEN